MLIITNKTGGDTNGKQYNHGKTNNSCYRR